MSVLLNYIKINLNVHYTCNLVSPKHFVLWNDEMSMANTHLRPMVAARYVHVLSLCVHQALWFWCHPCSGLGLFFLPRPAGSAYSAYLQLKHCYKVTCEVPTILIRCSVLQENDTHLTHTGAESTRQSLSRTHKRHRGWDRHPMQCKCWVSTR